MIHVNPVYVLLVLLEERMVIFAGKFIAHLDGMRRPVGPVQFVFEDGDRVRMLDDVFEYCPTIGAV